jgi:predicted dehydrogenase
MAVKKTRKLRAGVIGTGMIAVKGHIPGCKELPQDIELVSVADVLEERARLVAKREGIPRAYGDWRRMLRENALDIVYVCTPNAYHKDQSIAALQAGAHVMCEKPAATCRADAEAMFDAAKAARRLLFIGQSARFISWGRAAKEIVDAGRLGELYVADACDMRRRGVPTWGQFHMKAHSAGGPVLDMGVHLIDMVYWLFGNPRVRSVSAAAFTKLGNQDEKLVTSLAESGAFQGVLTARPYRSRDFDVEDLATGFIRLAGGAAVTFRLAWAANIPENIDAMSVLGTKGGLLINPLTFVTNLGRYQANVTPKLPADEHGWFSAHRRQTAHFVRAIRGEEELIVKREEVLNVMATLDAIYASARTGREIRLG